MAGFTCQICGGSIKMQANQTGVCQGCGMEYDIEAIRAMVGAQTSAPAVPAPAPTVPPMKAPETTEDEIDRDALLAYLDDVRTLETVLLKSKNVKESVSSKARALKAEVSQAESNFNRVKFDPEPYNKLAEQEISNGPGVPWKRLIGAAICILVGIGFCVKYTYDDRQVIGVLLIIVGVVLLLCSLPWIIYRAGRKGRERERLVKAHEAMMRSERAEAELDQRLAHYRSLNPKYDESLAAVQTDIEQFEALGLSHEW